LTRTLQRHKYDYQTAPFDLIHRKSSTVTSLTTYKLHGDA